MQHDHVTDEIREQAGLYAWSLLDAEQAKAFEKHLLEGCTVCDSELRAFQEIAFLLSLRLPVVDPDARLWEQLKRRMEATPVAPEPGPQVWKTWMTTAQGVHITRAGEGAWEQVGLEGVRVKRLYVDAQEQTATMLIRMEPGSSYPPHRHHSAEQCFVLEGDLRYDTVFRAGDYVCAEAGSIHPTASTEQGCLILVVSSLKDEVLS